MYCSVSVLCVHICCSGIFAACSSTPLSGMRSSLSWTFGSSSAPWLRMWSPSWSASWPLCLEDEGILLLEHDLDLECLRFSSFLPGYIAAEIRKCASGTLVMASSISLLEVSDLRLGETRPAATWFNLGSTVLISFSNWSAARDWESKFAPGSPSAARAGPREELPKQPMEQGQSGQVG